MTNNYESPFSARYASPYMKTLFSAQTRIETWRRLWVALARAEHKLGLPITEEQVAELEAHITDIDYEAAAKREMRAANAAAKTRAKEAKASNEARKASGEALFTPLPVSDGVMVFEKEGK